MLIALGRRLDLSPERGCIRQILGEADLDRLPRNTALDCRNQIIDQNWASYRGKVGAAILLRAGRDLDPDKDFARFLKKSEPLLPTMV